MASSTRSGKRQSKQSPDLEELLKLELQEIHSAETQLSRQIPRIMKAIESETLDAAIQQRLKQGERVLADVEKGLEALGASPGRKKNAAAEGLVNDIREHIQEIEQGPALDAVLIAALQKTEHYCIAAWGTVKAQARTSGQDELVQAMERAIKEGTAHDETLTRLAEQEIMPQLLGESSDEEDDNDDDEEETEVKATAGRKGKGKGSRNGNRPSA